MIVIFWRAIAWRPCVKLGHVLSAVDRDFLLTRMYSLGEFRIYDFVRDKVGNNKQI